MSDAARSQYADEVTTLSEKELQRLLEVASPPVCLLGGWAVHVHVTGAFRAEHGREYVGSRDVDLGVHVDPALGPETLREKPVAATLGDVESELAYERGRFGFYRYFHRRSGEGLDDEEAAGLPQHEVFRVDVDVLPSTRDLDAFAEAFGFRPPAEPLLGPVFDGGESEYLDAFVPWDAPADVRLASRSILAAMKVRAFPERDESHKRLKDLADLHALLWYGGEYGRLTSDVPAHLTDEDVERFTSATTDRLYADAASLIGVESDVLRSSIDQLFV